MNIGLCWFLNFASRQFPLFMTIQDTEQVIFLAISEWKNASIRPLCRSLCVSVCLSFRGFLEAFSGKRSGRIQPNLAGKSVPGTNVSSIILSWLRPPLPLQGVAKKWHFSYLPQVTLKRNNFENLRSNTPILLHISKEESQASLTVPPK